MWTSRVCREGSVGAKLHSIDWIDGVAGTDDAADGGWIALGTDSRNCSNVGISWIGSRHVSSHDDGSNASALYKSHFNLKGHTGEVRALHRLVQWTVLAAILCHE